ncbi:MAG: DUF4118 domain-containing protein [Desulfovibrionaceae bacterium]|nr:DUF4118 domain-containing protein [Desulfovibrionaceae bacterium]MBF0512874.1 DUF4118 domain-containing protein [Desulfovibrionaceae bacterium]
MTLPRWFTYVFALATTAATLLARSAGGFAPGDPTMSGLFIIPIVLSAYVGKLGPGLLSTALVGLGVKYFFTPEIHSFVFLDSSRFFQWLSMLAAGIIISVLVEALHRTQKKLQTDVAARRLAEEHLRIVSDNTYDWEYWRAPDGKYVWVSPSSETISGHPPGEFMEAGRDVARDIVYPPDRHVWDEHIREVDNLHPEHREIEFRIVKPTGEIVWIGHTCKPIFSGAGAFLGRRGCNRDITGHKTVQAQLIAMKDNAEASDKAKSEFLANMSHEIRTPLNGIVGVLQIMEMAALDEEQKEFLVIAQKSSDRLSRLLSDILDLSRIEAGKFYLCEADFLLKDVKASILEIFAVAVNADDIRFDFSIDERLPPVLKGDENRLTQILFNLVGNAIKFTQKGFVQIDASLLHSDCNSAIRVLFTVSDTGIGLSGEQLEYIFDPFTQVDAPHTKRFQGAGLGLSIVRKLVKMMGGELCIDSAEGEGTTVYLSQAFRLPGSRPEVDFAGCGK